MAGGVAGFFYAAVSTPIELIKCRQQVCYILNKVIKILDGGRWRKGF